MMGHASTLGNHEAGSASPKRYRMLEAQSSDATTPPTGGAGRKDVGSIVRSDRQRDFGTIGIGGGQRVFTVAFNDLAAVVRDTPILIYDPTRENVLAH